MTYLLFYQRSASPGTKHSIWAESVGITRQSTVGSMAVDDKVAEGPADCHGCAAFWNWAVAVRRAVVGA